MIEFKIITCPDKSQQATYQHLGRDLVFGKTEGDMIVEDPAFGPMQLKIHVESDKNATIENLNLGVEVRLNGKPISGAMPLKEKDNVTIARTTINFSRLDLGPLAPPDAYVHPNLNERASPGSKEKAIFDALDFLENSVTETGATPPVPGGASAKPPIPPGAGAKPPIPPGASASSPPPLPGSGGPPKPPTPPRKP